MPRICDRLVQPDAPAPPSSPPTASDPSSLTAWIDYFTASNAFLESVFNEISGIDFSTPSESDGDASMTVVTLTATVGIDVVTLTTYMKPETDAGVAEYISDAWASQQEQMAELCPQWDPSSWPYLAAPTVASSEPSESASAPAPAPDAAHQRISGREWRKITKDPDGHAGEQVIVYGVITQFDSATGTTSFRADVEASQSSDWYDYDTNTILIGSEAQLEDFVVDDIFRARVTVDGALDYETTMGGTMTVPQLQIDSIKRIGSAD